jgi:hypothetical protein
MRRVRIAAAAFVVLTAPAFAQSEGVAEFKGTMGGKGQSIPSSGKVYFSKVAYRTEWEIDLSSLAQREKGAPKGMMPGRTRMVTIQKLSDLDHIVNVNDDNKTYSVTDLKKLREDLGKNTPRATYTVQKLGRDKVAGFSCEKALLTSSSGSEMELCVSADLFPSAAFLAVQSRREGSGNLLAALRDNGLTGFPIRWSARSKGEQQAVATTELVAFEKKSVPSSLFEIPPDYREDSGIGVMRSPEQEKAMKDALEKMTPEQRKMYEEMMKKQQEKEK